MASLSSVPEDGLLHILQYAGACASARLGLTSQAWGEKILREEDGGFSQGLWREFAEDRWGYEIRRYEFDNDIDESDHIRWLQYYRHRSSSVASPSCNSPLDLIQEYYAHDPYRLLASCILCSRTSGGPTIRNVVTAFLKKYPTPTHVVEADFWTLREELLPLGLNREKATKLFAGGFLGQWAEVTELYGCGAGLASASFDVFCRGDYSKVLRDKKADRTVKAYASYLKRIREGSGEEEEDAGTTREAKPKATKKAAKKRKAPTKRNSLPARRMTRNRKQQSH